MELRKSKGESGKSPNGPAPSRDVDDEVTRGGDERPIRCAACRHEVTSRAARVSVHGAHEHRRVNPIGIDFHLGCFGEAPGCLSEGQPTLFWTWFPGYAWRIASCRACGDHLGWTFCGEETFFGLILDRLIDE